MSSVLVIDDSQVGRSAISTPMRAAGHTVVEAEDGKTGLESFRSSRPDITFLDLTMPVMDGIQVLEEIRRLDPKAKVVMVTANLKPSTLQRVTDLKVHSVLKKFPTRATLLAELQRLLGDAPTP